MGKLGRPELLVGLLTFLNVQVYADTLVIVVNVWLLCCRPGGECKPGEDWADALKRLLTYVCHTHRLIDSAYNP